MLISKKIDKYLKVFGCILALAFLLMPQLKYYSLHSGVADFGFYLAGLYKVNIFWQNAFYGHVQPYMILYGQLFKFFPQEFIPFILLGLQSTFLLCATILVWKYYGSLAVMAIILFPPLWINNLFDFHFDHIAVLLLTIFFISCKLKKFHIALISAFLLCFVKEIFALQAIACCIYITFVLRNDLGSPKNRIYYFYILSLIVFASLWFYISIKFLIPYFSEAGKTALESSAFSWLGTNLFEMFKTILFHPYQILVDIFFTTKKIFFILLLFGPFILIPLLSPLPLVVGLPILMISLLSQNSNYHDYYTHYTAGLIIPIIVAYLEGLIILKKWLNNFYFTSKIINTIYSKNINYFNLCLVSWLIFFQVAMGISPISRLFWQDKIWSLSYKAYISTDRDNIIRNAIQKFIPPNKDIVISSQNNINYLRLALRMNYIIFPGGVVDMHSLTRWEEKTFDGLLEYINGRVLPDLKPEFTYADYVLIDLKRPYFYYDVGCDTIYFLCLNKKVEKLYIDSIHILENKYHKIYEYDGFKIFKIVN